MDLEYFNVALACASVWVSVSTCETAELNEIGTPRIQEFYSLYRKRPVHDTINTIPPLPINEMTKTAFDIANISVLESVKTMVFINDGWFTENQLHEITMRVWVIVDLEFSANGKNGK